MMNLGMNLNNILGQQGTAGGYMGIDPTVDFPMRIDMEQEETLPDLEGAHWFEKYFTGGDSKDMSGYGKAKDMSEAATLGGLLGQINALGRTQRRQRAPVTAYMHPAIRGLLGG